MSEYPKYYFDVDQGSETWLRLRLAAITASGVKPIFKQPDEFSLYARGGISYIRNKVDEALFGEIKWFETPATNWGHENEPLAAEEYSATCDGEVLEVGFVELEPGIACSPDRLVGDNGLLEIKCPFNEKTHEGYLKKQEAPPEYLYQMLHQLYVTQRDWVDFFSFDPRKTGEDRCFKKRYTMSSLCQLLGETEELYDIKVRQTRWMIDTIAGMIKEIVDKRNLSLLLTQDEEETEDNQPWL